MQTKEEEVPKDPYQEELRRTQAVLPPLSRHKPAKKKAEVSATLCQQSLTTCTAQQATHTAKTNRSDTTPRSKL